MSFDYLRKTYGVPAKRGGLVMIKLAEDWYPGRIVSATHYVRVRPDHMPRHRFNFHPTDTDFLRYCEQEQGDE